ncbi:MAG: hypothetical protein H6687_02900 [Bacillales bacterium]|nr:hypothetical protein [Bacillales bacterium]
MDFAYHDYYLNMYIMPIIVFIIITIGVTTTLFNVINAAKSPLPKWLTISFCLFIASFLFIQAFSQFRFGYYLHEETPENAIVTEGVIEKIKEDKLSARYFYDGKPTKSSIITISGKDYYFMMLGNLEIGDEVSITYLPKSTIVLSVTIKNSSE